MGFLHPIHDLKNIMLFIDIHYQTCKNSNFFGNSDIMFTTWVTLIDESPGSNVKSSELEFELKCHAAWAKL